MSASRQLTNERERQQHEQRDERGEMLAEKRQPQSPERIDAGEHHLHQTARMRAAMERERELQHVLEIIVSTACLRRCDEPVGMERDQHAAADGEQAERDPGESRGVSAAMSGGAFAACVFTSASMMRPNRTGSANCATASAMFAIARIQASRASGLSRAEYTGYKV